MTPEISCSADGGQTWSSPAAVDSGDFPRPTVGPDGSVYVAYHSGSSVLVNKFSSCISGLKQQTGFPVAVSSSVGVVCPMPGLDRCNDGNVLNSPMVSVDDSDQNHVFVAFASTTTCASSPGTRAQQKACNEDVTFMDSSDGGSTFPRATVVNAPVTARRFMSWVCATQGRAWVSWYDRRAATPSNASDDFDRVFPRCGPFTKQPAGFRPGV